MKRLHVRQTSSTMTLLERDAGAVLATADCQTCGRGQRGNTWHSRAAENLLLSLRLRPVGLAVERRFRLMQRVALALVETLADFGIGAEIKWPNDIYVGHGKVCGFIVENRIAGGRITESLAGIGLNVNQTEWPSGLPNPVSMRQAAGRTFDCEEVLAALAGRLLPCPPLPSADDAALHAAYMQSLYRREGMHPYADAGGRFEARIAGVTPEGLLLLGRADGSLRAYGLKEVTFVLK